MVEATYVHTVAPLLAIALVEVATERGLNEIYQLPVGLRPEGEHSHAEAIATVEGWTVYDALTDPELAGALVDLVRDAARVETDVSVIDFQPSDGPDALPVPPSGALRAIGEGHSNSSVVLGEELVLKVYRLLAPGDNPEVELLRFLTGHGFANTPALLGSYEHSGRLIDSTLGIVTRFVPAEDDGWTFALSSLESDPGALPRHARAARRGHGVDARRARVRLERPGVRRRGAEQRVVRAARRDARRGDRGRLRAPARRRGRGADPRAAGRRCASACAGSRA